MNFLQFLLEQPDLQAPIEHIIINQLLKIPSLIQIFKRIFNGMHIYVCCANVYLCVYIWFLSYPGTYFYLLKPSIHPNNLNTFTMCVEHIENILRFRHKIISSFYNTALRTSLVILWLRICLAVQGTQV